MKAQGLVVSDKKIFENCILKPYCFTPWPTYATNWNGLNNFGRGPHRDHSCEVWSKSNERFQRRRCLSKQEGPEGPGSLIWGKGQRSQSSHLQRTTNVVQQIWKLWALYFQTRRFLKIEFWKPYFWPRDLLMQPIRTIWTILVEDNSGTIPVEFGQIPISGSKKEIVWKFPYIIQCKIVTPEAGSIFTPGA